MAACRAAAIDPEAIRLVAERYTAHREFAAGGRGSALPVEQWFRFYHLEKASEGSQTGPAPSACSVDNEAVNEAVIAKPQAFLDLLRAWLEAQETDVPG